MSTKRFKAFIFDLDGTLLDTKEGILKSLEEIIERKGYPKLSYEKMLTFVGPPMAKSLAKEYNLSKDEAFSSAQEFRDLYAGDNSLLAEIYPNIPEVLETLKREGCKLGVATYKREDVSINLLNHFGLSQFFDSIHGSDFNGKMTKAEIVKLTMNELSVESSEVLVIGDTIGDGLASNEVGATFAAVQYGYGFKTREELDEVKPEFVISEIFKLLDL